MWPPHGLFLNMAKSLLFALAGASVANNPLCWDPSCDRRVWLTGFTYRSSWILWIFCSWKGSKDSRESFQGLVTSRIQMETTLLRSCLALPKVSYALRTCPPYSITQIFDGSMSESLSGIAGSPLSDWAWPLFQWVSGGPCYAPAAFIGSLHHSSSLIAEILGWIPDTSTHLPSALSALAEAAGKPGWCSIQDIAVSLHLSRAIVEASYSALLSGASDPHFKALALSPAIQIG